MTLKHYAVKMLILHIHRERGENESLKETLIVHLID